MRLGSILTLLVSVALAVLAGVLAQLWLEQQRMAGQPVVPQREFKTGRIVVATQPLRFGAELTTLNLREIEWPAAAVPAGAFSSTADLLKPGERRVVLSAIEINEPILRTKITGAGQRASLSSVIDPKFKAVTIRVNDVFGVAGFVLPGDRVDILLTRAENSQNDTAKSSYTDVLLQHVRVLGIDQLADDRTEKPSVVKAVTLEVDTAAAQKLTLAGAVGSLSLALRPAGSTATTSVQRITAGDLGASYIQDVAEHKEPANPNGAVVITRAVSRTEYSVPGRGAQR